MQSLAIEAPFAGDPIGADISRLTGLLFDSPRRTWGSRREADVRGTLAAAPLKHFAPRLLQDNPQFDDRDHLVRAATLEIYCRDDQSSRRLATCLFDPRTSRLPLALTHQGIGQVEVLGTAGVLQCQWRGQQGAWAEQSPRRRRGDIHFQRLMDLIGEARAPADELAVAVADGEEAEEVIERYTRPRESAALVCRGFRRILSDHSALVFTAGTSPSSGEGAPGAAISSAALASAVAEALTRAGLAADGAITATLIDAVARVRQGHPPVALHLTDAAIVASRHPGEPPTLPLMRLFRHLSPTLRAWAIEWCRDERQPRTFYLYPREASRTSSSTPVGSLKPDSDPWGLYDSLEAVIAHQRLVRPTNQRPLARFLTCCLSRAAHSPRRSLHLDVERLVLATGGVCPAPGDVTALLHNAICATEATAALGGFTVAPIPRGARYVYRLQRRAPSTWAAAS